MKVVVIGGGPAGMMAAISSAENGNEVILLEKMNSLGRKLLITGKGRCNITSSIEIDDFIKNIPGNGMFLYSAFKNYTNQDIIEMMKDSGVEVKEERGNRIFPVSDKSLDVLKAFTRNLKDNNVDIKLNTKVNEIIVKDGVAVGVKTDSGKILADKIILATGGRSYPLTGSTGDGYEIVKKLGHTITDIRASLVPLETYETALHKELQGLSLRNIAINIIDKEANKKIYDDFGEMLFTHFGVSGPVILSGSSHLVRYPRLNEKLKSKNIILQIDLKPALSEKKLDDRILRDFEELKNKEFKNSLEKLLPQKLIPIVIDILKIAPHKKVNEITKEERQSLVKLLKCFELKIKGFRTIDEAIVTAGGINVKEINPKTMESKIVQGLYFAGEIIDVDAYTGGFNLQIAYSTGYTAGQGNY